MEPETPICLVGMMGAGKTTVGRDLARRLGRRFVDIDQEVVARTGVQIPVIFEIEGEDGFRKRETQVLSELLGTPGVVIATGGGIVLAEENRALLREHAFVVLIEVSPEVLWERTRRDRNRPLLQVENPRQRIRELHAQRAPLYREVANLVMSGGRGSAHAMARNIERELRQSCER